MKNTFRRLAGVLSYVRSAENSEFPIRK